MSSLFRHFDTVAHTFLPFRKMPSWLTETALPGDYKEFLHGLLFPVALVLIDDSFITQTRTRQNLWRPVIKVHPTVDAVLQHHAEGALINGRTRSMGNVDVLLRCFCTERRTNAVVFEILWVTTVGCRGNVYAQPFSIRSMAYHRWSNFQKDRNQRFANSFSHAIFEE